MTFIRFSRSLAATAAATALASIAVPALASVSDLDVSFCREGESIGKKLELTVGSAPYASETCVRYANLGSETISVSIGFADGFMLADGRPGCADQSADLGHFASVASYVPGSPPSGGTSFVLQPGQSIDRTLRLELPSMPSEPILGCLISGPAPVSTEGATGINVVVRRANIVRIEPVGYSGATTESIPVAATGQTMPEAPTVTSSPTSVPSSIVESEKDVIRQEAPKSVELFADARNRSVPLWFALCLFILAFGGGLLASSFMRRPR